MNQNKSATILIATHKTYTFPKDDMYVPIHVGREGKENLGYLGDNTEDNISEKNNSFCELTGLYWAWKNNFFDNVEYCGLSHYRRYFKGNEQFQAHGILSQDEVTTLMAEYDVLLPKKRYYIIETIWQHYANAHHIKDLEETKKIIAEKYPEYVDAFDSIMNTRSLHIFNMFVMKKELFDNYMSWLFDILFELEKRLDISDYDPYQRRIFGFISERLFNVWLARNNHLKPHTVSVVNIEGENLLKKAIGLLRRKFLN